MQSAYIILIMLEPSSFVPISFVEDFCLCDGEGNVTIFPDLKSAVNYRDDNAIDGKVVELPLY